MLYKLRLRYLSCSKITCICSFWKLLLSDYHCIHAVNILLINVGLVGSCLIHLALYEHVVTALFHVRLVIDYPLLVAQVDVTSLRRDLERGHLLERFAVSSLLHLDYTHEGVGATNTSGGSTSRCTLKRASRVLLTAALALTPVYNPLLVRRHHLRHTNSFLVTDFLLIKLHFIVLRLGDALNKLLRHLLVLLNKHRARVLLLDHVHLILRRSHHALVNGQVIHRRANGLLI